MAVLGGRLGGHGTVWCMRGMDVLLGHCGAARSGMRCGCGASMRAGKPRDLIDEHPCFLLSSSNISLSYAKAFLLDSSFK